MTLTIDDVIALRANCDDYVNAFKVLEQSKLDFQRAEDNLMSNLPAVGFRVTGQTNIDDLPTIVKDSMVSKASKQLDSGKITINDRDVEKPVHPVQGLVGTPIEMMSGIGYFNYNIMPFDGNNANPLRAVYYAARLLELPKPILYCV